MKNGTKYEITVGYGDGVIKDYTAFLPEDIQNPKSSDVFERSEKMCLN